MMLKSLAIFLRRAPISVDDIAASIASLELKGSLTKERLELIATLFSKKNEDEVRPSSWRVSLLKEF